MQQKISQPNISPLIIVKQKPANILKTNLQQEGDN